VAVAKSSATAGQRGYRTSGRKAASYPTFSQATQTLRFARSPEGVIFAEGEALTVDLQEDACGCQSYALVATD